MMWGWLRCNRRGHEWFPNLGPSELLPRDDFCLRCPAVRVVLPTGQCLGGHPMSDHYDDDGWPRHVPSCQGPA